MRNGRGVTTRTLAVLGGSLALIDGAIWFHCVRLLRALRQRARKSKTLRGIPKIVDDGEGPPPPR